MSTPNPLQAEMQRHIDALQADPASKAFAPLAEIYRRAGRHQEALSLCKQGLAKNPEFSGAQVLMAQILIDLQQAAAAESTLIGLLRRIPNHLLAHQTLLRLYLQLKRAPQAQAIAQRLIKLHPADPNAQAVLRGQVAAGAAAAAKTAPPGPTLTMAKLYEDQGHLDKALEIYRLLAKSQPAAVAGVERLLLRIANQKKVAMLNSLLVKIKQQFSRA